MTTPTVTETPITREGAHALPEESDTATLYAEVDAILYYNGVPLRERYGKSLADLIAIVVRTPSIPYASRTEIARACGQEV